MNKVKKIEADPQIVAIATIILAAIWCVSACVFASVGWDGKEAAHAHRSVFWVLDFFVSPVVIIMLAGLLWFDYRRNKIPCPRLIAFAIGAGLFPLAAPFLWLLVATLVEIVRQF